MYQRYSPLRRAVALLGLAVSIPVAARAQSAAGRPLPAAWVENAVAQRAVAASPYAGWLRACRALTLDVAALRPLLATAPLEGSPAAQASRAGVVLTLPAPDGTAARFRLVEAPVLAPEAGTRYPQVRTYAGVGLDDPTASLRCDLTPLGFHAQVLSARTGTWFIEPVSLDDVTHYVSFAKTAMDLAARGGREACGFRPTAPTTVPNAARSGADQGQLNPSADPAQRTLVESGTTLRTYRLCVAATQEYVAARGGTGTARQKKVRAVAAIVTSVNRVTGVYEKEMAVRMVLIPNFDTVVYVTNDPYTNNDGGAMLGQNQSTLTARIGGANYDIGHVFSTGGGGIASLGSVCNPSRKAQGVTGLPNPVGDAFDIDYVAHEIGHQFAGNHPFNGTTGSCSGGNRNPSTAWEPGSGSTIMAYAGICGGGQDLQNNSDAYFHTGNFQEMMNFIVSTGTCPVQESTGNTPPVVTAPASGKTIPKGTPFKLTASATDAEGDALTYNWEEMDLGAASAPINSTTVQTAGTTPPLFRSYNPLTVPTRYFPRLSDLVRPTVTSWGVGQALPSVSRTMRFRCTARDQHVSAALGRIVGGVAYSNFVTLNVTSTAGPFVVQTPNLAGITWFAGTPQTVTWDVAGTDVAPVSCATVDILLSRDGGLTYPDTLARNVPNSGTAAFVLPATTAASNACRVMVAARDNFFFDISNTNFVIQSPAAPTFVLSVLPNAGTVCTGSQTFNLEVLGLLGFTDPVALTVTGAPAGVTASFTTATVTPPGTAVLNIAVAGATPGTYPLTISGTGGGITQTIPFTLTVGNVLAAAPVLVAPAAGAVAQSPLPTFAWDPLVGAVTYTLQLATDAAFTNLVLTQTGLTGTTFSLPTALGQITTYYWRVRGENTCGGGAYAAASSFTTANTRTATVPSSGTLQIPSSSAATVTSTVTINSCDLIADLNVSNVRVTYGNLRDLTFTLISPDGSRARLAASLCANTGNMNLSFDDQAATPYVAIVCPATAGATVRPQQALQRFNGRPANGTWVLEIVDSTPTRGGVLLGWQLDITTLVTMPQAPTTLAGSALTPQSVTLTWADNACNETEQVLERAPQGSTTFTTLATLTPNEVTYTDATLQPGIDYCYRVRAVNGTLASANSNELCLSAILGVAADVALNATLTVAPNPSTGTFGLALTAAPVGPVALTLTDALGRAVRQYPLQADATGLHHQLELSGQPAGVYVLRLTTADGRTAVRRLVKL